MRVSKEERKEHILDVATTLFSQAGYQKTDVQKIADAACIGKGTLYLYFSSKEDLFFAAVDRAIVHIEAYVKEKVSSIPDEMDRIKAIIRSYVEFFRIHPEYVELFVQERAEFRFRRNGAFLQHKKMRDERWTKILERLLQQGKLRFSNIPQVINTINQLFYGIIFTNIFQLDLASFEARIQEGIDMLMYGIFLPPGER
jgi:AcrR family transcriptional regulator